MLGSEFCSGSAPMSDVILPARIPGQQAATRTLIDAYQSSGGVIGCDDLTRLLGKWQMQPISCVARSIVSRQLVHFDWQGQRVLPLFQFEYPTLNLLTTVADVIAEFGCWFNDSEIAEWFATPNGWLQGALPARVMVAKPMVVLDAARADRFALLG